MVNKTVKKLRNARALAIFFLVITLLGSLCILATSFLDGPTSAKISDFIKGIFQKINPDADINYGNCSGLTISTEKSTYFVGQTTKFFVEPVPAQSTLLPYKVTATDPSVVQIQGDEIVFLQKGASYINVSLVDHPEISSRVRVWCVGYDAKEYVDITCDKLFGDDNTIEARSTVTPTIYATLDGQTYHSVDWSYEVKATITDLQGNPTDIAKLYEKQLVAYKPGQILITFNYGAELAMQKQVQVNIVDTGVHPMPTTVVLSSQTLSVYKDEHVGANYFIEQVLDENGNDVTSIYASSFNIKSDNQSIVWVNENNSALAAVKVGQTMLTFTCMFNDQLTLTVPIQVVLYEPQSVHIVGDEFLYIYDENYYKLKNENGQTIPNKDILWSVDGDAKVDNGVVTVSGLKTVTLTATIQTSNGPMTTTRVLKVRFYQNFQQFVRKIAGHFTAFFVLGACTMITSILCSKNKKFALLNALAYCLLMASISEVFQLPIFTPGRTFSPMDILLNFLGTLFGCSVVTLIFAMVILALKLFAKDKGKNALFALKNTKFGRLSKKNFASFVEQFTTDLPQ